MSEDPKHDIRFRLKKYIYEHYVSVYNLAQKTGINATTMRAIIGEHQKSAPGSEILYKLKLHDPQLDLNWLITGQASDNSQISEVNEAPGMYVAGDGELKNLTKALLSTHTELIDTLNKMAKNKVI
jgi:hypothetical protein